MGKPAARVGDPTAHGPPLTPPGEPTVLIGGMPAYRLGDPPVACPMATPNPHGPESVIPGMHSTTVLIGGKPAVRVGDQLVGAGPPNSVLPPGCPTVLIG